MKTTSIFPVHGPASLILMSKYARSRHGSSLRGFPEVLPKSRTKAAMPSLLGLISAMLILTGKK